MSKHVSTTQSSGIIGFNGVNMVVQYEIDAYLVPQELWASLLADRLCI